MHGCGGAGLSAVAIAAAAGARVSPPALELAAELGAERMLDASAPTVDDPGAAVAELTGGAHLSLNCLGTPATCAASVRSLCRRGTYRSG